MSQPDREPQIVEPNVSFRINPNTSRDSTPEGVGPQYQADDGELVAQYDRPLAFDASAQQQALSQQIRLAILVPPGVRAGLYHVVIGIYDPATGERLRLANGDTVFKFVTVTVES